MDEVTSKEMLLAIKEPFLEIQKFRTCSRQESDSRSLRVVFDPHINNNKKMAGN